MNANKSNMQTRKISLCLNMLKSTTSRNNKSSTKNIYNNYNFYGSDTVVQYLKNDEYFKSKYSFIKTIKSTNSKCVVVIKNKYNVKYLCKMTIINRNLYDVINESNICKVLLKTHNKYISNYIDYYKCDKYMYFINEFIEGMTLSSYITYHCLTKEKTIKIISQILKGLTFLHQNNIMHCDIKTDNIMINKSENVKIIDFDLSRISNKGQILTDSVFGTKNFIAPESYDLCLYSYKSDIWSLGIVCYILINKNYPIKDYFTMVKNRSNVTVRRNMFKHPESISPLNNSGDELNKIILSMLKFNLDDRPTTEKLLEQIEKIDPSF